MLNYSIVIATRNRPAALRLSIPRMLTQTRLPSQLIVVDSSDDHEAVVEVVKACVEGHLIDWMIINSERGVTRQRNIGLKHVAKPVVFFPDDDSIWFSDTAEAQMRVYERDTEKRISAVCAAESSTPPLDWELSSAKKSYELRFSHRIHQRIGGYRTKLENRLFPDPAKLAGRKNWPDLTEIPCWFQTEDVVFVEYMTGFRMSFRTPVIQSVGFDEILSQYSLCEDIDASLGAWSQGWVVAARKARVFHYRAPERRENGNRYGVCHLLNKAYVVTKHTAVGDYSREKILPYSQYKIFLYALARGDEFSRERYLGAKNAFAGVIKLTSSPRESAGSCYENELRLALAPNLEA